MRTRAADMAAWDESSLRSLAGLQMPQSLMGQHSWLLEADVRLSWARWYVDGLVDCSRFIRDKGETYARLYAEVISTLRTLHPLQPVDELRAMATAVAEMAWDYVERMRNAGRRSIRPSVRKELWHAAEPHPRCYLCGYLFPARARDRFLGRTTPEEGLEQTPPLLDFTRPRGEVSRDVQIEVDHVTAAGKGGSGSVSNLRLACGWCNKVKSDRRSILDAPATFKGICVTAELGEVAVPQPTWVLRIVGTRGRCESPGGCDARLDTQELFIASRNEHGSITPTNAMVTCAEHDPWNTARWVGRGALGLS